MILNAQIDDQIYALNVPDEILANAGDFFDRMDADMDQGVQMSREWVERPDLEQRCRVVANKLLTALENENPSVGRMMAGYILARMPNIDLLNIDTSGDITGTLFQYRAENMRSTTVVEPAATLQGKDKMAALAQAGNDVSKVFKAGKQWKFSVYDHKKAEWVDSPAFAGKAEADALREKAVKDRYNELLP